MHRTLGPGLLESVYEAAFAYELQRRAIPFTRQKSIPGLYEDIKIDVGFRADITMDEKLLIEIKSVDGLENAHHKTVLTYLRMANLKLGLLVNFNVFHIKDGIKRKILGQIE
jgi:GxxExxY protein